MSANRGVPATSLLVKFESVGRLGSVKAAALELGTSSPSVSRSMRMLEEQLSVSLVERVGNAVKLTDAGQRYHEVVTGALGVLRSSAEQAAQGPGVVIACSHDASHLLLMPRLPELEALLGEGVRIRVLTYQRNIHELQQGPDAADVVLSWQRPAALPDSVTVLREDVQPICSPDYLAHAPAAEGSPAGWGGLTLLDLRRPNMGWATWQDYFSRTGSPEASMRIEDYDTYTQILEAASAGRGIALGWRWCIESYLERGALVALQGFECFGGCYVAFLTAKGRRNALARRCLALFGRFASMKRSSGWSGGSAAAIAERSPDSGDPESRPRAISDAVSLPGEIPSDLVRPLKIVEMTAAAGGTGSLERRESIVGTLWFTSTWLDLYGFDAAQCIISHVRGRSMEPTLPEDCAILVDRSRRRRRSGGIFLVWMRDGFVVKRLERTSSGWALTSDNPAWKPVGWRSGSQVVGEVRWTFHAVD